MGMLKRMKDMRDMVNAAPGMVMPGFRQRGGPSQRSGAQSPGPGGVTPRERARSTQ